MIKIAPSLLAADFNCLGREIESVERLGADMLHLDVMDGHFTPNLTIGVPLVASLRKETKLFFDAHLMIEEPLKFIQPFAQAGADMVTFHIEVAPHPEEVIQAIKDAGMKAGLALNPPTALSKNIRRVLEKLDLVLFMTVNPGFGGQKFMPEVLPKIKELKALCQAKSLDLDIEVDGGINPQTAREAVSAGANVLVAGTAIFGNSDREASLQALRS